MMEKLLALLATCTMIVAGCAQSAAPTPAPTVPTPRVDLWSDATCDKPCVLGISPGKTTRSEAWTILKDSQFARGCEQKGSIHCDIIDVESYNGEGIVDLIRLRVNDLPLEQLLSKYGNPDGVQVQVMPADQPSQAPYRDARLIYKQTGALVNLEGEQRAQYEMAPSTPVVSIMFMSKKMLADLGPLVRGTWHGYGYY